MKVLFLDVDMGDFADFFREQRNRCEICDSQYFYNKTPSFLRKIIQFIGIKIFEPILYLIYGNWKKKIDEYDCFILPSRKSCKFALKLLKNKKVIIYYWNLITDKEIMPSDIQQDNVTICTFDEGDAKKYKIKYVDTYYFDLKSSHCNVEYDLFYVGIIRPNRIEQLQKIKDYLCDYNVSCDFHIMNYNNRNERLTYSQIIDKIQTANVIVDLTRENQLGLTLRPLEALQFNKKLITNNKNIINYEFYNKNNIFILGVDDMSDLLNFIQTPYVPIPKHHIEKYYFEKWLQRIIEL